MNAQMYECIKGQPPQWDHAICGGSRFRLSAICCLLGHPSLMPEGQPYVIFEPYCIGLPYKKRQRLLIVNNN